MKAREGLTYNTDRDLIKYRQYGRIIQDAVERIKYLSNRKDRTHAARRVIQMMAALTPGFRNTDEHWHKLWDHLYLIANLELDIDAPFPPPHPPEKFPPQKINYPTYEVRYRFLGRNVESLIQRALRLPHEEMRIELINIIANFMRMAYRQWNKGDISKEKICHYIHQLSEGAFEKEWLCNIIQLTTNNGHARQRSRGRSQRNRR